MALQLLLPACIGGLALPGWLAAWQPGDPGLTSHLHPVLNPTTAAHPQRPSTTWQGMELGLRCMAAAGADTVMTTLNSPAGRFSFADGAQQQLQPGQSEGAGTAGTAAVENGGAASAPSATSAPFEAFLAEVAQTGVVPLQMPLFCAHQMGTCRLGESWGCSGMAAALLQLPLKRPALPMLPASFALTLAPSRCTCRH